MRRGVRRMETFFGEADDQAPVSNPRPADAHGPAARERNRWRQQGGMVEKAGNGPRNWRGTMQDARLDPISRGRIERRTVTATEGIAWPRADPRPAGASRQHRQRLMKFTRFPRM